MRWLADSLLKGCDESLLLLLLLLVAVVLVVGTVFKWSYIYTDLFYDNVKLHK